MAKKKKKKLANNVTLRKSWIWPSTVTKFVESRIEGYSLNVCAGVNTSCDVNMDLDPQDKSILRGDMRCLPFKSNTFDTVISDPPWGISYYLRFKPFFEAVRVCRVGGKIIYNATWIPSAPSGDVELREVFVRQDNHFSTASVISVFEKVRDNPQYEENQEKLFEELSVKE